MQNLGIFNFHFVRSTCGLFRFQPISPFIFPLTSSVSLKEGLRISIRGGLEGTVYLRERKFIAKIHVQIVQNLFTNYKLQIEDYFISKYKAITLGIKSWFELAMEFIIFRL